MRKYEFIFIDITLTKKILSFDGRTSGSILQDLFSNMKTHPEVDLFTSWPSWSWEACWSFCWVWVFSPNHCHSFSPSPHPAPLLWPLRGHLSPPPPSPHSSGPDHRWPSESQSGFLSHVVDWPRRWSEKITKVLLQGHACILRVALNNLNQDIWGTLKFWKSFFKRWIGNFGFWKYLRNWLKCFHWVLEVSS